MHRRTFMIGGLATSCLTMGGCVPLISIVLRGGLGRFAARSFTTRGVNLLGIASRGVGSSVHISRLASFGPGKTSILGSGGRTLGVARTSGNRVYLEKNNAQLTYTMVRPNGRSLHHLPDHRQIGSSYSKGKRQILHYDARGRLSALDKISRDGSSVEHFTARGQKIGITRIDPQSGRVYLRPNSSLEQFLDEVTPLSDGICTSAKDEWHTWQEGHSDCQTQNMQCATVREKLLAFQNALKNCG